MPCPEGYFDVANHLALAGFTVCAVHPPRRSALPGENVVVAHAIVRRYGYEIVTVVRMDRAGEVYTRLADADDTAEPVLREIGDDDA